MKTASQESMKLPAVLDITAAAPLAAGLLGARGKDVVVDASDVERMGAQCLQVLLSAAATWTQDGMELDFAAPSTAFCESVQAMGLELADLTVRNV